MWLGQHQKHQLARSSWNIVNLFEQIYIIENIDRSQLAGRLSNKTRVKLLKCAAWPGGLRPQTMHRSAAQNAMVGVVALWYLSPFLQTWHDVMLIHSWSHVVHFQAELLSFQQSQNQINILTRDDCVLKQCVIWDALKSVQRRWDNLHSNPILGQKQTIECTTFIPAPENSTFFRFFSSVPQLRYTRATGSKLWVDCHVRIMV